MRNPFPHAVDNDEITRLMKEYGLTRRQLFFAEFYLKYLNATHAAELANFGSPNVTGSYLLANASIKRYLSDRFKLIKTPNDVLLGRLDLMASFNLAPYLTDDGKVNLAKLKQDGYGIMIKGVKPTKYGNEIIFHDSVKIAELIGKNRRLFADVVVEKSKEDVPATEMTDEDMQEATQHILNKGLIDPDDLIPD